MAEHTAGPLQVRVLYSDERCLRLEVRDPHGDQIASLGWTASHEHPRREEVFANVRLIIAGPKLLEAAKAVLASEGYRSRGPLRELHKAVAKAEGN